MAWKSITFKPAANGRFVTKRGKTSDDDSASVVKGTKLSNGKAAVFKTVKGKSTDASKTAGDVKQASSQAIEKHRNAMSGVILEAKKIAEDRREALNSIKDPDLKRSAAR